MAAVATNATEEMIKNLRFYTSDEEAFNVQCTGLGSELASVLTRSSSKVDLVDRLGHCFTGNRRL